MFLRLHVKLLDLDICRINLKAARARRAHEEREVRKESTMLF